MTICKCCGTVLALDPPDKFTKTHRKIYDFVAAARGRWVSTVWLIEHVYPNSGKPHSVLSNRISVHVGRINRNYGRTVLIGDKGGHRGYRLATERDGVIS